jgi:DNA-binding response OmpR family regulator
MNVKTPFRILVVEDDLDIGSMIKIMLEYHGYSVVVTHRADKVAAQITAEPFDLIIMDMLLSGINGVDVCASLKQDKALAHIPVIMISAHPNAREISQKAGAEGFLPKPFDMQEMLAKVNGLVGQKTPS